MTRTNPNPDKATHIAAVIREQLTRYGEKAGNSPVGVSLSGGVDSCAVLAGLLEGGSTNVQIVSYTPSTHESTDFQMARQTAANHNLPFHPAVIPMDFETLDYCARQVIKHGYTRKVQVESMAPMIAIRRVAKNAGIKFLFTGDQSDGYFALSRSAAIPTRDAQDSGTIDAIRKSYYDTDKSCSGPIAVLLKQVGIKGVYPFRDIQIYNSFLGTHWREVNKPRIKEPVRQAFEEYWGNMAIQVRPVQVNLHKGDSHFGDTFSETLLARYAEDGHVFNSPVGLFNAIKRGEV